MVLGEFSENFAEEILDLPQPPGERSAMGAWAGGTVMGPLWAMDPGPEWLV